MTEPPADDRFARRTAFAAAVAGETGIDEAMIHRLVHAFYDRVRADELLAPIFASRVEDWTAHLAKMCDFWSSVVLMTGRYHGRPMPAHATLPVEPAHFAHWLALFEATATEVCPPPAAALFLAKARLIAANLSQGVAIYRQSRPDVPDRLVAGTAPPPRAQR